MFSGKRTIHATGLAIWTGLVLLVFVYGNPSDPVPAILLLSAISLLYLTALWQISRERAEFPLRAILFWALAFRLTALFAAPVFSDDLYRMRWEGKVAAAGVNPFDMRPAEAAAERFRDETWPLVDGKDFKAVYGPLLQSLQMALFRIGGGRLWAMKLGACAAELAILFLLLQWLRLRGLPDWRLAAWAWSPLAAIEFWGMGHHDAVMMALVVACLVAAETRRWPVAGSLLGLAGATKFWPLLLAGALVRLAWKDRGWVAAGACAAACFGSFALCWWPWWTDVSENVRFLGGFVGGWRNNDILFGALLLAAGSYEEAKRIGLGLIGAAAAGVALGAPRMEHAAWAVPVVILLVSANVHPWYLTWLLPLAVLRWPLPVLLWGALVPLHYAVLIRWRAEGVWDGMSDWRWVVYGPVILSLAFWIFRTLKNSNRLSVAGGGE